MKTSNTLCARLKQSTAVIVAIFIAAQVAALTAGTSTHKNRSSFKSHSDSETAVIVNRNRPPALRIARPLTFSGSATDEEISQAGLFPEPLVTIGPESPTHNSENVALANALRAYQTSSDPDELSPFVEFLKKYPHSVWRASLLTNLGILYRRTGYFLKALDVWEEAWALSKNETTDRAKSIADLTVGELAELNARLGRYDRLESLFSDLGDRILQGPATEKVTGAKEGLWLMRNKPEAAFRCGPMALSSLLLAHARESAAYDQKLLNSRSTTKGMSLAQVAALAAQLKMNLQMAKRQMGAEVLLPGVVHWKAGHFAAIVKKIYTNGRARYLIQDPTFGADIWVTDKALDEEGSGYFLVPRQTLPSGWAIVGESEGQTIWGKGNTGQSNPEETTPDDPKVKEECSDCQTCNSSGMAQYDYHAMLVSLNIVDTPVGYVPPRGPAVKFTVTYNQREAFQPAVFSYSNLGRKWTFDWLSYVTDNPLNPFQDVTVYRRGGGQETFAGNTYNPSTQQYAPDPRTHAVLVRTSSASYERRLTDGSKEVFSQPSGSSMFVRKLFLSQIIDKTGNTVELAYDSQSRLIAVTDAIGQVSTLSYDLSDKPLTITRVTDPFGRYASFEYDAAGQLSRITDVIGLTSAFTYGPGDFVNKLITPYGTTSFSSFQNGTTRWIEATDQLGQTEHVEYTQNSVGIPFSEPANKVPSGMFTQNEWILYRNTFFWDKKAWSEYPHDYTKAKLTHWLHGPDWNTTSSIKESEKKPLENRVWYDYPGQFSPIFIGTSALPTSVGRVLDDGSSQVSHYQYNSLGKIIRATDPLGRSTTYVYANNQIDLLEIRQTSNGINDLLARYTYNNAQHLPLTYTDASGQTTAFTYNSHGQLLTVKNPKNETTSFTYDTNGYLTKIAGPVAGATTELAYDSFGRIRTVTESDGYTLTRDYDSLNRLTKVSYPNGTAQQLIYDRLDIGQTIDRLNRVTEFTHDALRRLTSVKDPLGRQTQFSYCSCGGLAQMIDANGHTTTWNLDLQGRVIGKVLADGKQTTYQYENSTERLKRSIDAKGQTTNYEYTADNNLKRISYDNAQVPTADVVYTYDSKYNRVITMQDGAGTTAYAYNPVGQQLGAGNLSAIDGPLSSDTIAYSYDELGRVISRSINGIAATAAYDQLGRVTNVNNALGGFSYSYVGATDRLASSVYPNGRGATYTYFSNEGDRRLKQVTSFLAQFGYTYYANGNIRNWSQIPGPQPSAFFTYDQADQLTKVGSSESEDNLFSYEYDGAGNRTKEGAQGLGTIAGTFNETNELISRAGTDLSYDSNGNLVNDGSRTFEWDAVNRLTAVTRGTHRSEFSYDGLGRRTRIVEKEAGTIVEDKRFVWCALEICEERNSNGNGVTKRFFNQGVVDGDNRYFFTKDHLGSIRVMTNAKGNLVARYEYDPYGRATKFGATADADFGYAGYYVHRPSGLNLTMYRAYDANFGRWLSRDPIEERGGLNLYGYVNNSPVNSSDPTGLLGPVSITAAVICTAYNAYEAYNTYKEIKELYERVEAIDASINQLQDILFEPISCTTAAELKDINDTIASYTEQKVQLQMQAAKKVEIGTLQSLGTEAICGALAALPF
ncbi:MAG TPA: RHS repeat-associated core domain-containing protein [Pyrinomonadaceae bacterium]